jgi:hypothetical protein
VTLTTPGTLLMISAASFSSLAKDSRVGVAVRKVAKALGLPDSIYQRIPFPGPAWAARVIGEATPERIDRQPVAHRILNLPDLLFNETLGVQSLGLDFLNRVIPPFE